MKLMPAMVRHLILFYLTKRGMYPGTTKRERGLACHPLFLTSSPSTRPSPCPRMVHLPALGGVDGV